MDNIILSYHRVLPRELIKERGIISVTTDNFEKQLRYFYNKSWNAITLKEYFFDYIQKGVKPQKKVIITFDDGYRDNYLYAFPILEKYNFKATIFLTAGYLDSDKALYFDGKEIPFSVTNYDSLLRRNEIEEMNKFGNEFGSHTLTHPRLSEIVIEKADYEIKKSKEVLENYLGTEVVSFCYPYGNLNEKIVQIVKEAKYKIGVVTPSKSKIPESNLTLKRTGIYFDDDMMKFLLKNTPVFYKIREMKFWRFIKMFLNTND